MNKTILSRIAIITLLIIVIFEGALITLGVSVINDLVNGKQLCEAQKDSIIDDYTILQNEVGENQ